MKELADLIRKSVTARFIETTKPSTVSQIAQDVGFSTATVRTCLGDGNNVTGIEHELEIPYPGTAKISVYYPTRAHLADIIKTYPGGYLS